MWCYSQKRASIGAEFVSRPPLSLTSSLSSFRRPHQFRRFPRGLGQEAVLGPAGERRPGCHLLLRKRDFNCKWRLSELNDCFSAAPHGVFFTFAVAGLGHNYLHKWQFWTAIRTLGQRSCSLVKEVISAIVAWRHGSDLTKDFYYQAAVLTHQTACRYQRGGFHGLSVAVAFCASEPIPSSDRHECCT